MSWFNWRKPKYDIHIDYGGDDHYSARLVERGTTKPMLMAPVNARFRNPITARRDLEDRMRKLGLASIWWEPKVIVEGPHNE